MHSRPDHPPHSMPPTIFVWDKDSFANIVLNYRTIWLSDIHLGTRNCQADFLHDFLTHTRSDFLYLVGDIVDGWQLRKRWFWPESHQAVIHEFLHRSRLGTKVTYLPGNHDEAARHFCGLYLGGVFVTDETVHTTAAGKRLLILHGDQFDAVISRAKWIAYLGDIAYEGAMFINSLLNSVRRYLGLPYWSLSAYLKKRVKQIVNHISTFEDFIAACTARHKATGVVCGHIHHAQIRMTNDILYCNDGDWVESCTALVEDHTGQLSIIHWPSQRSTLLTEASRSTL